MQGILVIDTSSTTNTNNSDNVVRAVEAVLWDVTDYFRTEASQRAFAARAREAVRGLDPNACVFNNGDDDDEDAPEEPLLCALARTGPLPAPETVELCRALGADPARANAAGETPLLLSLRWLVRHQRFAGADDATYRMRVAAEALFGDAQEDAAFSAATCTAFARWCLPSPRWRQWLIALLDSGLAGARPALRLARTGPLMCRLARVAGAGDTCAAGDAVTLLCAHGQSALEEEHDEVAGAKAPAFALPGIANAALAELLRDAVQPAPPTLALALACGLHARLGADSPLRLVAGATELLIDLVLPRAVSAANPLEARHARLEALAAAEGLARPLDRFAAYQYLTRCVPFDPAPFRRGHVVRRGAALLHLSEDEAGARLRAHRPDLVFDTPLTPEYSAAAMEALLLPLPSS